ncbi:hypothetical protein KY331_01410, partial [Candidatus Woesearchaeota archaeon]|nr:hypothetical protein [Candidatus Woesearchaeota archaeon]
MNVNYDVEVLKGEALKILSSGKSLKEIFSNFDILKNKILHKDTSTKLTKQLIANKNSTYTSFMEEMKTLIDKGNFVTGYAKIDEILHFSPGDFVILQSPSNHGKSSLIGNLAY